MRLSSSKTLRSPDARNVKRVKSLQPRLPRSMEEQYQGKVRRALGQNRCWTYSLTGRPPSSPHRLPRSMEEQLHTKYSCISRKETEYQHGLLAVSAGPGITEVSLELQKLHCNVKRVK